MPDQKTTLALIATIFFIQLLTALVFGFVLYIAFGIFGAFIGGTFGFFDMGGLSGYESAGLFFGFLGAFLGIYGAAVLVPRLYSFPVSQKGAVFGAALPTLLFFLIWIIFGAWNLVLLGLLLFIGGFLAAAGAHLGWILAKRG